jgi:hypothetical protein
MRVVKSRMAWERYMISINRRREYTGGFGQKPERNGGLTRPMCRCKDNIKIYFKEVERKDMM